LLAVTFAAVDWGDVAGALLAFDDFPDDFRGGADSWRPMPSPCWVTMLASSRRTCRLITPKRFRDLGNLMLMLVMFWPTWRFSQFMLIWIGNLPDEVIGTCRASPGAGSGWRSG